MKLQSMKLVYLFSCVVLGSAILLPALMALVSLSGTVFSAGEVFSELWILGPNHMAEGVPFAVSVNEPYKIFLGAGNFLGELEYYAIYVKFGTHVEDTGNKTAGLPSPLEPLREYRVFLRNNQTWEIEFPFSFGEVSFEGNVSTVSGLTVDGHFVTVDKVAVWDEVKSGFYYQLIFELWIYDVAFSGFRFHNRSVGMWLNMSVPL